ncbi:MAG TPA: MlaD family protein [Solirubrobacteraceae bacterium]|nr:MlaD family protein [Solirubrobacteraceae bacterium]
MASEAKPPTPPSSHEGGRGVRDQVERYRSSFIAVVTMIVLAAVVGGYILAHQNLHLPGWVPVLGKNTYTLKARFQTAQAVTPGQGQAVTIAGAKVGEVASVEVSGGVATVTMRVTPKYARFYKNATMLMRPKTALQDMTIEVNPGTPRAGKLHSGEVVPVSQTAPNGDFDEFLAGLDTETRYYLQALLAGAGEGLYHNGRALSATLKRFLPTTRLGTEITHELQRRHKNIAQSIHNFRLLVEAIGGKNEQLAELVSASNAVFATFAKQDANFRKTLHLLPGALEKTGNELAKVKGASRTLGKTLTALEPFAKGLAPAQEATRKLSLATTPIIKNEIRPFAREILPVVNELAPSTEDIAEAFPKFTVSFGVLNEFFNELAYNPGPKKAGFLFFLDWGNHDLNSVVSTSDANGPLGRSLVYFNCEVLPLLKGVSEVNPTVNLLVGLLNPPNKEECQRLGLIGTGATAASTSATAARVGTHNTSFNSLEPMHVYPTGTASHAGSGSSHAHKAAAVKTAAARSSAKNASSTSATGGTRSGG